MFLLYKNYLEKEPLTTIFSNEGLEKLMSEIKADIKEVYKNVYYNFDKTDWNDKTKRYEISNTEKEIFRNSKSNLPVLYLGTFKQRILGKSKENFKATNFCQLDLDFKNQIELGIITYDECMFLLNKYYIKLIDYSRLLFISPSGLGLKAILEIDKENNDDIKYFINQWFIDNILDEKDKKLIIDGQIQDESINAAKGIFLCKTKYNVNYNNIVINVPDEIKITKIPKYNKKYKNSKKTVLNVNSDYSTQLKQFEITYDNKIHLKNNGRIYGIHQIKKAIYNSYYSEKGIILKEEEVMKILYNFIDNEIDNIEEVKTIEKYYKTDYTANFSPEVNKFLDQLKLQIEPYLCKPVSEYNYIIQYNNYCTEELNEIKKIIANNKKENIFLIRSDVGSGKTTMLLDQVKSLYEPNKTKLFLLVQPNRANVMNLSNLEDSLNFFDLDNKNINVFSFLGPDELSEEENIVSKNNYVNKVIYYDKNTFQKTFNEKIQENCNNLVVVTYESAYRLIVDLDYEVDYIFLDEIHRLILDQTYRKEMINNTTILINKLLKENTTIIGLTATPLNLYLYPNIIIINMIKKEPKLKDCFYFYSIKELPSIINSFLKEENTKIYIYSNNRNNVNERLMEHYKGQILYLNKNNNKNNHENKEALASGETKYRIILSTSVIQDGVSFLQNTKTVYIILDNDPAIITQVSGRCRKSPEQIVIFKKYMIDEINTHTYPFSVLYNANKFYLDQYNQIPSELIYFKSPYIVNHNNMQYINYFGILYEDYKNQNNCMQDDTRLKKIMKNNFKLPKKLEVNNENNENNKNDLPKVNKEKTNQDALYEQTNFLNNQDFLINLKDDKVMTLYNLKNKLSNIIHKNYLKELVIKLAKYNTNNKKQLINYIINNEQNKKTKNIVNETVINDFITFINSLKNINKPLTDKELNILAENSITIKGGTLRIEHLLFTIDFFFDIFKSNEKKDRQQLKIYNFNNKFKKLQNFSI